MQYVIHPMTPKWFYRLKKMPVRSSLVYRILEKESQLNTRTGSLTVISVYPEQKKELVLVLLYAKNLLKHRVQKFGWNLIPDQEAVSALVSPLQHKMRVIN